MEDELLGSTRLEYWLVDFWAAHGHYTPTLTAEALVTCISPAARPCQSKASLDWGGACKALSLSEQLLAVDSCWWKGVTFHRGMATGRLPMLQGCPIPMCKWVAVIVPRGL